MCDKMAISAHILKIDQNDPFLRLQMTAKVTHLSNDCQKTSLSSLDGGQSKEDI